MKPRRCFAVILAGLVLASGCHNTAQGIKTDTRNAVQKTGHGVEKAGEKVENAGKK
jgi:predicted small secreted protein